MLWNTACFLYSWPVVAEGLRQVFPEQFGTAANQHGLLNEVFQLPDVTGPGECLQCVHRLGVDVEEVLAEFRVETGGHPADKWSDVLHSFSERGQMEGHDVEA